jgi:hypothetical protein
VRGTNSGRAVLLESATPSALVRYLNTHGCAQENCVTFFKLNQKSWASNAIAGLESTLI